ncbi:AAA family ATPase [Candidatus Enterococcus ferrettii]|uniref:Endonuclease GajA/Old nuclease/RecF-like AAA domain-containing protein n=1 Tax=Candidatus Enterococcus ferrettii TaxID=2815324 RepID=A0ABV0EW34_9ENTE|nr:AAA family ATPase [Enterococcus sp. 665A]MBO1342238.1 ATP-binding protein [Enterococcus sp. 665A]
MLLEFENIAKIKQATIELTDLTVITGVNNSGKGTVSKILYALLTGINLYQGNYLFALKYTGIMEELENLERWVDKDTFPSVNALRREVQTVVYQVEHKQHGVDHKEIFAEDTKLTEQITDLLSNIQRKMSTKVRWPNRQQIAAIIKTIFQQQNRDYLDEKTVAALFDRLLRQEFSNYIISDSSLNKSALLSLQEEDDHLILPYKNNRLDNFQCQFQLTHTYKEAICLDDPDLLDNLALATDEQFFGKAPSEKLQQANEASHRKRLIKQIMQHQPKENYLRDKKIAAIFSEVLNGQLVRKRDGYYFFPKNSLKGVPFNSLSSGTKIFALLQLIVLNGLVADSGCLIFFEPETHLHPQWQVKLAELLVRITTVYSVKVLITSRSPYIIEALDIFSTQESIRTKFYNTSPDKRDPKTSLIVDTTDNLEAIYAEMYQPLIYLEQLRAKLN